MLQKGFTLIELLIVIAILAILTAAVVVVLNPAQLLAQARDSQRLSDLSSVTSAISLWLTTATSPTTNATSVVMVASTAAQTLSGAVRIFKASANVATSTQTASTNVSGTGWVPDDLTGSTGGSPLGALPSDPTNNASFFYSFCQTSTSTFEVDAVLESTKYTGKMSADGGDNNSFYENGTNLAC